MAPRRNSIEVPPEAMERFLRSFVHSDSVYKLKGLLIPLDRYRTQTILKRLNNTTFLKKLLKKKKVTVRNPKTGELKATYLGLNESQSIKLTFCNEISEPYYEINQITSLINLYIKYEWSRSARRSKQATETRLRKLLDAGWEVVDTKAITALNLEPTKKLLDDDIIR